MNHPCARQKGTDPLGLCPRAAAWWAASGTTRGTDPRKVASDRAMAASGSPAGAWRRFPVGGA